MAPRRWLPKIGEILTDYGTCLQQAISLEIWESHLHNLHQCKSQMLPFSKICQFSRKNFLILCFSSVCFAQLCVRRLLTERLTIHSLIDSQSVTQVVKKWQIHTLSYTITSRQYDRPIRPYGQVLLEEAIKIINQIFVYNQLIFVFFICFFIFFFFLVV